MAIRMVVQRNHGAGGVVAGPAQHGGLGTQRQALAALPPVPAVPPPAAVPPTNDPGVLAAPPGALPPGDIAPPAPGGANRAVAVQAAVAG